MSLRPRARLLAVILAAVVLSLGAVLLARTRAAGAVDEHYIVIAKATLQGQAYFRRFPAATCSVDRSFEVTVNCDYDDPASSPHYVQHFRVTIDPMVDTVTRVDIRTNAP